ncbi:uncharacterized protein AMSG_03400 [Thecamonas trahens ATCC 50062]|uniref:Uncharacterized protein n=1 Tax=Thecamonas trahens ATCC 50062 TaxID=461836 RepID=A0A0L0D3Q1_THETB|nr:hypothetical protein AMSG_03400 [Thecamonas trahens ATCC 50062]KNC46967.1 hypothetical protein AMSG_03400 [Thecamonas trahens ATCC 50062]|eukprot:XP_013760238.1 hypothetical protein AMSG_03400 [Thecamonas trahens ATCC 50062]
MLTSSRRFSALCGPSSIPRPMRSYGAPTAPISPSSTRRPLPPTSCRDTLTMPSSSRLSASSTTFVLQGCRPGQRLGPLHLCSRLLSPRAPELIHRIKRKPQKRRRGQLTRAARIAATGNPPATSDAARVTDLRVEVESLKRTRDEYEHAIDSMAMRQADMERRVADLDATAEALRDQVDAARNQHAALAAAIDNLRAVLPPGFTAAMAPQASVPVAPAPMDLAAPQQPIATRLHNETLDLIFGTIVSPTLSTDSDGPFPPVSLRPGLSATPPLPVDDRHDYTRPLKRARPLAPIDAPKDHHAHDPFWTHAGALLTPTWASRT